MFAIRNMKINVPGCCCDMPVPPTTYDNSVQPISHLLIYVTIKQKSYIVYSFTYGLYAIITITEHENKQTWLPLGYAGPSNDEL